MRSVEEILRQLDNLNMSKPSNKPSYYEMPRFTLAATAENAELINELIKAMRNEGFTHICRNDRGRILRKNWRPPCWDAIEGNHSVELTICSLEGNFRLLFGNLGNDRIDKNGQRKMTGTEAWRIFEQMVAEEFCPDLSTVAAATQAEGLAAKALIPKPLIQLGEDAKTGINHTYHNVNHIDLHSAHCAGMAAAHPEYHSVFEHLYAKRKENPEYKNVLTHIWGAAQSRVTHYKFSDWSRQALEWTNKRVLTMVDELKKSDRRVLLLNTDGIWYQGKPIEDEGNGLGQWANDYIGCRLRIKSKGAYEYEEPNGNYKAVVRGLTKLDRIKSRDEWDWGSIFMDGADEIATYYWDAEAEQLKVFWQKLDGEDEDEKDVLLTALYKIWEGEDDYE